MSYELRRRGFRVEAAPNPVVNGNSGVREFDLYAAVRKTDWEHRFLNKDGSKVKYVWSKEKGISDTRKSKLDFINEQTLTPGRYEIYCSWKGKNAGAHVFIIERNKSGMLWFDPQSSEKGSSLYRYLTAMNKIGIMRIDDKLINPIFAKRLHKATE